MQTICIGVVEKLQEQLISLKKTSCLDPNQLSQPLAKSLKKIFELILNLSSAKTIYNDQGDEGISEFRELLSKEEINATLICYKPSESLDSLFFQTLAIRKYKALSLIVQTILVLHNGQAEVERGFSINKHVIEDNMSELSSVPRRLVKDYLRSNSLKSHEVTISSGMVSAVQQSSSQY